MESVWTSCYRGITAEGETESWMPLRLQGETWLSLFERVWAWNQGGRSCSGFDLHRSPSLLRQGKARHTMSDVLWLFCCSKGCVARSAHFLEVLEQSGRKKLLIEFMKSLLAGVLDTSLLEVSAPPSLAALSPSYPTAEWLYSLEFDQQANELPPPLS